MRKTLEIIISLLLILYTLLFIHCSQDISVEYNDAYDCWVFLKSTGELIKLDNENMMILKRIGGFVNIVSIEVDPDNSNVFICDSELKAVIVLDKNGEVEKFIYGFYQPSKLIMNPVDKTLWVIDRDRLIHLSPDGNIENTLTGFGIINDIDCSYNFGGRIWLASNDNYVAYINPDGFVNCKYEVNEPILVSTETSTGYCWFLCKNGDIRLINEKGEIIKLRLDKEFINEGENPIIVDYCPSDYSLWVGYLDGKILRFDSAGFISPENFDVYLTQIGGMAIDNEFRFLWSSDLGLNRVLQISALGDIIQSKSGLISPGTQGVVNKIY
ncbi:MAG: hypothetical protein ACUVWP_03020 [bacterium]